jgi:hypothetical protein
MKTRIHLGPVAAIALRPDLIVSCEHVARPFKAATITTESGVPYHEEFIWEDRNGTLASVRACDFSFSQVVSHMEDDLLYCRPWRPVFEECIVELQPLGLDDGVWIEHKRLGWTSSYVVAFLNDNPLWPVIRYKAQSGDSGTLVWSADRTRVVGFVSATDARGCVVRTPNLQYQFPDPVGGAKSATVFDLRPGPVPNPAPIPQPTPPPPPTVKSANVADLSTSEARLSRLRESGESMVRSILENCPDNRERSVAVTQLQTALLWAGTSIAPAAVLLAR